MLNVSVDTVYELINLAREFHAQEQVSFPEDAGNPSGDWAVQMLADHAGDATADAFIATVNDLDVDQQQELVALFWIVCCPINNAPISESPGARRAALYPRLRSSGAMPLDGCLATRPREPRKSLSAALAFL